MLRTSTVVRCFRKVLRLGYHLGLNDAQAASAAGIARRRCRTICSEPHQRNLFRPLRERNSLDTSPFAAGGLEHFVEPFTAA